MLRDDLKFYKIVLEVIVIFDVVLVGYFQGYGGYGGCSGQLVVFYCFIYVFYYFVVYFVGYNLCFWL